MVANSPAVTVDGDRPASSSRNTEIQPEHSPQSLLKQLDSVASSSRLAKDEKSNVAQSKLVEMVQNPSSSNKTSTMTILLFLFMLFSDLLLKLTINFPHKLTDSSFIPMFIRWNSEYQPLDIINPISDLV